MSTFWEEKCKVVRVFKMRDFLVLLLLTGLPLVQGRSQFWYINDIHYDPTYNTTGESCIDDVTERASKGDYNCDAPWQMVDEAVSKMVSLFGEPEFIVWGGANAFHTDQSDSIFSEQTMLDIMTKITDLFRVKFPGIQVVPVIGNHDWFQKSQLPANGDTTSDDLYDKYLDLWQGWIPLDYRDTFMKAGYYKINLSNDLITAIVLNSDLYLEENEAVTGSDPGGQLQWLRNQLTSARQTNKKVHIITHASIGDLQSDYNLQLIEIVREFSDEILAIYGGHQKTDQYRLIYDEDGKAVSFVLLAPSLSPRPSTDGVPRNPAFRRYYFDDNSGALTDSEQFHLNLAGNLDWGSLYKYSLFGITEVNAESLHQLLTKMEAFGSEEFHDYHKYKHVDIGLPYYTPCSCQCKYTELCAIKNIEQTKYLQCMEDATVTCGAEKKYYSVILMFVLFLISKIIHL